MTEENTQLQNPSPEEAPEPLVFTDACVAKVKELLAAEEDPNMPLRVFVQGGERSGKRARCLWKRYWQMNLYVFAESSE